MSALQGKAMLAALNVGTWAATAVDQRVSRETARRERAAERGAGSYRKILASAGDLKEIRRPAQDARHLHYRLTLPWRDGVDRLLPVDNFERYKEGMDVLIEQRRQAVEHFIKGYEEVKAASAKRLGDMYREQDFPSADDLRLQLTMGYELSTIPDASHFIADIGDAEADRIKRDIERRTAARLDDAITSIYSLIGSAVSALAERLEEDENGKAKFFKNSIIDNLLKVLDETPALNITNDPNIQALADEARRALDGIDPDELRPNKRQFDPNKRKVLKGSMETLKSKFDAYYGTPVPVKDIEPDQPEQVDQPETVVDQPAPEAQAEPVVDQPVPETQTEPVAVPVVLAAQTVTVDTEVSDE